MYKYVTSILLFLVCVGFTFAQENKTKQDSITYKTPYGLRLGVDISKPILNFFDSNYSGLEFVADYRISKDWYIAGELGREENLVREDFLTVSSNGSYFRVGANHNVYNNWLDMNNEVFVGFRYGMSFFDQTLESYTINSGDVNFLGNPINNPRTDSGLTTSWFELMLGIKVETFKNFFISFSSSYKLVLSVEDPVNFQSLYAPGFNRIYASNTGFGFNYTISYLIPFKKK